jgi:hypothetical protein
MDIKHLTSVNHKSVSNADRIVDKRAEFAARMEALSSRPKRHPAIHWAAFVLSIVSLGLVVRWVTSPRGSVPTGWVVADIVLGTLFLLEFLTRSGFRWGPARYAASHWFDFVAMAPALLLVQHGVPLSGVWVWLILVARVVRVVDRLLGDGFIGRNIMALGEGLEEEITDRVLLRTMARIQADLDRGQFGQVVSGVLQSNKSAVLERVRAATPHQGLPASLAHLSGLDTLIERVEERTYDAVAGILSSPEIDKAIRESVDASFAAMKKQIGTKSWKQHIGIKKGTTGGVKSLPSSPKG